MNRRTQKKIKSLIRAIDSLNWDIAIPGIEDDDSPVRGMIIGEREYLDDILEKLDRISISPHDVPPETHKKIIELSLPNRVLNIIGLEPGVLNMPVKEFVQKYAGDYFLSKRGFGKKALGDLQQAIYNETGLVFKNMTWAITATRRST